MLDLKDPWSYYERSDLEKLKVKFNDIEKIERNYSQSFQDMFVLSMLNGKRNGIYVEVGAAAPFFANNTYILEQIFEWTGVSLEIDETKVNSFNHHRSNKCICSDAMAVNYSNMFEENNFPKQIDYLQIDIEPAFQSLNALKKIDLETYRFSVITFETDIYSDKDNERVLKESREVFQKHGYKLVASNVKSCGYPYEDWYVDPKIVPENIWKNFECDSFECTNILYK